MSELLESRWQETKEALLEGLSGTKKSVMGVTLENTRKYLSESATAGSTSAGNVATLNRDAAYVELDKAREILRDMQSMVNREEEYFKS